MKQLTEERKQFLFDVFVTALEGGIGYWSRASQYHIWKNRDTCEEDLNGFYAVIHEWDEDAAKYETESHKIDIATIQKGIRKIVNDEVELADTLIHIIKQANRKNDAGEIDSDLADCVVQIGLFDRLIYG